MDVEPIQVVAPTEHKSETGNGEGVSLDTGLPVGDMNEKEDLAEEGADDELAAEEGNGDFSHVYSDGDKDYDDDDVDDDDEDDEEDDEEENEREDDFMEEDVGVKNKDDDVCDDKEETPTEVESKDEENKAKVPESSQPKVEKLRKVRVTKKVFKMNLDEAIVENKDNSERDVKNDPVEEAGDGNIKGATKEKEGETSKDNAKKLRRGRNKVIRGSTEKVASKAEHNPSSSRSKKGGPKRAESMGMIFMCSSKTKKDCYRYQVLGLPAAKRGVVEKIYQGMRLFLYDVDLKLMYGIYKAAGRGGYNIEPKAFKSQFPSQVRFTVLDDCVPLAEEKFKKAIKENYYTKNKFGCLLKHQQVKNLCKLFIAANKVSKSKSLDRSLKVEARASKRRNRSRAQGVDERRRSALDEKHRYHDYPRSHQREVVASPVARAISPLPPPVTAPRYAYDRTMEMDPYRHPNPHRQPFMEPRDAYRQPLLSDYCYVYRQEPPLGHYDAYRRDGVPERRDLRPLELDARHRDEIAGRDPYILPRERQSYHDPEYGEHLSSVHDRYRYAPTEYRSRAPPMTDYSSTRSLYRY